MSEEAAAAPKVADEIAVAPVVLPELKINLGKADHVFGIFCKENVFIN